jgi:DNA-binding NarL/FixJ family response regulator
MIRVWVVEDNATFRDAVVQEINGADSMRCEEAFGSCEALLERLIVPPPPDVILLDIRLPGISGLEAISKAKACAPKSQIIMLTSFEDKDRIFRAICAGASGYLLKSADDDIPNAVQNVVNGGSVLSPPIARSVLDLFGRLASTSPDYHLTPREKSILDLMVQGLSKKQIADRLKLSFHTVDGYLRSIYNKLHVNSAISAVAKAVREGLC